MALESGITEHGLRVYVDEINTALTTFVDMRVQVGSAHELPSEAGLAHILEHTVHLEAAPFANKPALEEYRGLHGITGNAETSQVDTRYFALGPDNTALFTQIGAIVCAPKFCAKEVNSEMQVVTEEARQRAGNIQCVRFSSLDHVLSNYPYGREIIGHISELGKFTAEDVEAFYRQHYTVENMRLYAAGNISLHEAMGLAEQYIKPRQGGELSVVQPHVPQLTHNVRSGYVIPDAQTTYISRATLLDDPLKQDMLAHPAVYIAAEDALSDRYKAMLRATDRIAYFAHCYTATHNLHPSAWKLLTITSASTEHLPRVEERTAELLALSPDSLTDAQILSAIGGVRGRLLADMDSKETRVKKYAEAANLYGEPYDLAREVAEIKTLTVDAVREAVAKLLGHFAVAPSTVHMVGPEAAMRDLDIEVTSADII